MVGNGYLHPDDTPLFLEVATKMREVAKTYNLPMKSIEPMPRPEFETSNLGDCNPSLGHIRLVLRGMQNGQWAEAPRTVDAVYKTAAHELAHLRYIRHDLGFHQFEEELRQAMMNRKENHRDKIIDKLVKMQKQRDGEAQLGNIAAAEAFASAINRMLIEHELNPSDIDYATSSNADPVIQIRVDLDKYGIARKKDRIAWQETLAGIVARGNLCSFLLRKGSNDIWFVGTRAHATVAEYLFGVLVPAADLLSDKESYYFRLKCRREGAASKAHGYREAWLNAFVRRVEERIAEVKNDLVKQDAERRAARGELDPSTTALVRLNGALKRVQEYMDDRFSRKRKYANPLQGPRSGNAEGSAAGRAAADRMPIGRKGISSGVRGYLE
jgi:hypothetical protein